MSPDYNNPFYFNPNQYPLDPSEFNPTGSPSDFSELANQIRNQNNTANVDFNKNPLVDNPSPVNTTNTTTRTSTYNPYIGLVNVFDFGLNSLANFQKRKGQNKQDQYNQFEVQQPEKNYFNKRMLRGDKVIYAKMGGEYIVNKEYEIDENEVKKLTRLGYEFEIL